MSKIAITGNDNGSGTFTIASPNSNTDRTLTLPDADGSILTSGSFVTFDETNDRLGIGTTSPADVLHIKNSDATIRLEDSADSSYVGTLIQSGNSLYISAHTHRIRNEAGTEHIRITNGGDVGIGTTTPATKLHIKDDTTTLKISDTGSNLTLNDEQVAVHLSGRYYTGTADPDAHEYSDARIVLRRGNTDGTGGAVLAFENSGDSGAGLLERMRINSSGDVLPGANGTQDFGSTSLRWANIYTSDLHLSNGIGDYTVVEGEEDLFLYNNKNGKTYKFVLAEVDPKDAPKKMEK